MKQNIQNMRTERKKIFLAGLLHDIGKFYQRADKSFNDKQSELSEHSKNIANDICPVNDKGRFGYQHVVWGSEFFESEPFKSVFKNINDLNVNLYSEENDLDGLINLAVNHHKPQTLKQTIVTIADWWSAGIDRREAKEVEEGKLENESIDWGKNRYKQIPLYSVFNQINSGNYNHAFSLKPLDLNKDSIFPKDIKEKDEGVSQELYNKLWEEFKEEFQKLPTNSLNGFIESLLFLLKKYTWCIPSNTMDMANVSLFDHLKTTAAFADCIYTYHSENPKDFNWNNFENRLTIQEGKHPVILLGGDVSGIQKFIYNIASRKAAVSLKGRSFYLQLLIDSVIQRIISHGDIDATLGHVVYSSGGKFYMLLPNTEKVKKAIAALNKEFETELWNEHKGKLIINMDYVPFAFPDKKLHFEGLINEEPTLGLLWQTLAEKLSEKKNQKFKTLLLTKYKEFFEEQETGGEVKVCAVSGFELKKGEYKKIKDSDTYVSNSVYEHIELGEKLKDVNYLLTYKRENDQSTYLSTRAKHKTTIVNVSNYLFAEKEVLNTHSDSSNVTSSDHSRVIRINNTNFLNASLKGQEMSYGFQFYGGNEQAYHDYEHRNRTFEELTRTNIKDEKTESYFGVLRMDVDGLGEIFIKGIPDKDKTFSAYATLSSHLDWFFSGYLNTIREKYKDNINILYSGGDDVFAVGRWDTLLAFAEDIRNEFKRFLGRDDISISAGMSITNNKYPIAKAAELAGEAEHEAKMYASKEFGTKNAIHFLGTTVSWNTEFTYVKSKKNEFITLIENFDMSKAILHRLMLFAEIQANNERNKDKPNFVPDLSYHWNAAYYLKRYMENKDNAVKEFCKTLQIDIFSPRSMKLIALAARWAELELKDKKEK